MRVIKFRISFLFFYVYVVFCGADSSQSFNYERMQMLGSGRRMIQPFHDLLNKRDDAFPEPLPPKPKPKTVPVPLPYRSLYQGARKPDDKRVFRRRFHFSAEARGQRIFYDGMFDCPISFLAVETEKNIPVILRGGVGYNYFNVVIKSRPYDELTGQVRAFCVKTGDDYYKERQTENLVKLYIFTTTTPADK